MHPDQFALTLPYFPYTNSVLFSISNLHLPVPQNLAIMHFSNLSVLVTAVGSATGAIVPDASVLTPDIYIMDNKAAGASIVSLSILFNGLLSVPARTSASSACERAIGADSRSAGPDSLFTQNAVVVPSLNSVCSADRFQSNVTAINAKTSALKPYFNFAAGGKGGFNNVEYGNKLYV